MGDAGGGTCLVEVLRDHLEEGGLTSHAETAGQLPGEHSAAGQIGDEHQCNYINDGISSVEKPYPQKAQIQTLLKGGGVKGIGWNKREGNEYFG